MISALVAANEILPEKKYLKLAEELFSKIEKKYIKNKIYHSYSKEIVFLRFIEYFKLDTDNLPQPSKFSILA